MQMSNRNCGKRRSVVILLTLCICVLSVSYAADDKPIGTGRVDGRSSNDENSCQINIEIVKAGETRQPVPMTVHFPITFWEIVRQVMRNRDKMFPGLKFDLRSNVVALSYDVKHGSLPLTGGERDESTKWTRHSPIAERLCDGKYGKNGPIVKHVRLSLTADDVARPVEMHVRNNPKSANLNCKFTPNDWQTIGETIAECLQKNGVKTDGQLPVVAVEHKAGDKYFIFERDMDVNSRTFTLLHSDDKFYAYVLPADRFHPIHMDVEIYDRYKPMTKSTCTVIVLEGEAQSEQQIASDCRTNLTRQYGALGAKQPRLVYDGKAIHNDKAPNFLRDQSKKTKVVLRFAAYYKVQVDGKAFSAAVFPETTIGDVAKQLRIQPKKAGGALTADVLVPSKQKRRLGRPYTKEKLKANGKPHKTLVANSDSYLRINDGKLSKSGH